MSTLHEDPRGYYTDRQAELLTERVESGAVTYSLTKTTERDYEVSACVVGDRSSLAVKGSKWIGRAIDISGPVEIDSVEVEDGIQLVNFWMRDRLTTTDMADFLSQCEYDTDSPPVLPSVRTVYVAQDDANTAYSDAMLDHAERLANDADAVADTYNDDAYICEGRR